MKLSQLIMGLAALCAIGAAQAQSSVAIYGVIDVGVEYIRNVGAGGDDLWRVPSNTSITPSRLGLRGNEALGAGFGAVFTLEMGIAPDQGTAQFGRLFGRQAFAGISSPYGTVSLGRQYTMLFWSILDADILAGNVFGSGSLDPYLPNARADNSIAWRGMFSGLTLGATYSLGRDVINAGPSPVGTNCPGESATERGACREWSVLVKYDSARWGVAVANDRLNGRSLGPPPDAVFGGLNSSDKTDDRLSLNGYVKVADGKIGGGLIRRRNDGDAVKPKSDLWYLGASYPIGAWTLDAQLLALRFDDVADRDSTLFAARALYNLSRRTAVYVQIARIENDALAAVSVSAGAPGSNPPSGGSQNALNVGVRHLF